MAIKSQAKVKSYVLLMQSNIPDHQLYKFFLHQNLEVQHSCHNEVPQPKFQENGEKKETPSSNNITSYASWNEKAKLEELNNL